MQGRPGRSGRAAGPGGDVLHAGRRGELTQHRRRHEAVRLRGARLHAQAEAEQEPTEETRQQSPQPGEDLYRLGETAEVCTLLYLRILQLLLIQRSVILNFFFGSA